MTTTKIIFKACELALTQGVTVGIEWKNNGMEYEIGIGPGEDLKNTFVIKLIPRLLDLR